jgi:hypothetical protein
MNKMIRTRKLQQLFPGLMMMLLMLIQGTKGYSQACPVPTLTAPTICQGQPISLNLSTAPASGGPYTLVINGVSYPGITPGTPFTPVSPDDNFWGNTVPFTTGFEDNNPYELGVKFKSSTSGFIKGIRFYRDPLSFGPFTATLWTSTGTALATGAFNVSGSGWQEMQFASPVAITAGVTYVASYYSPNGRYAFDDARFATTPVTSTYGNLTAPASGGPDGSNGVFKTGASGFPDQSVDDANYYVDVIFSVNSGPTAFNLTSITDGTCLSTGAPLSTATVSYNPLPSGTISSPTSGTAGQTQMLSFNPGVGSSPYSLNINGNTITGVNPPSTFDAGVIPLNSTYRLWTGAGLPEPTASNDGRPVEVGMKFRPLANGTVTALRFYKGVSNTNPTILKLYSGSGTLLATATHIDGPGTETGFKEVTLASPVSLTANTLYMVAYYSAAGDYVKTDGYMTSARTNLVLTATANGGADGANGMYHYDAEAFPDLSCTTCNGPNYWADVVFNSGTVSYTYNLVSITDLNGCTSNPGQLLTIGVSSSLPVSLTDFRGMAIQQDVKLDWSTASESNNRGFEIMRSDDGGKWLGIGFVNGNGTSGVKNTYTYTDRNRPSGKFYYRLKQVDLDGKFNYSNILVIDVNRNLTFELNQNYPNPSRGLSTITYAVPARSHVKLTLYDINGRVVKVLQNGEQAAGKYAVTVPAELVNTGLYYYKMEAGSFKATRKMIVQ